MKRNTIALIGLDTIHRKQLVETGLLVIAGSLLYSFYGGPTIWLRVALAATLLTLLVPGVFYPLAVTWFALGRLMGKVTSNVILVLLFVGLVVPVALIRRALGKDALRMKQFKKGADSVFVVRNHTFVPTDLNFSILARQSMEFLREFWLFLRTRKRYWLFPLIVLLLMLGALSLFTAGSALAPFIYSLF